MMAEQVNRWAMMKWWWYVQWYYDGIYNVVIMIYLQMRIYLQSTDGNGMYNEALTILWGKMKWEKIYDEYIH